MKIHKIEIRIPNKSIMDLDLNTYLVSTLVRIKEKKERIAEKIFATILAIKHQETAMPHQIATLAELNESDLAAILDLSLSCICGDPSGVSDARAAFLLSFTGIDFMCRNMHKILGALVASKVGAGRIYRFIENISLWSCNEARLTEKTITFKSHFAEQCYTSMFTILCSEVLRGIMPLKDRISVEQMEKFVHYFQ